MPNYIKDAAERWYRPYIDAGLTWDAFKNRFLVHFDDPYQIVKLATKLYGEHQEVGFCTSLLIAEKTALARNQITNITDSQVTLLIY